jgi:6-pyruvoyltetrahydropterin/6-carboxytetrahydropterin synthase
MYELKIISQFSAAHQLRGFAGQCEQLHGHNWKVEVYVTGRELAEDGMLVDFRVVKDAAQKVLDTLDHRYLNELEAFCNINPSSENIARHIFECLSRELNSQNAKVAKVTAWESDSAAAAYMEE